MVVWYMCPGTDDNDDKVKNYNCESVMVPVTECYDKL